MTMTTIEPLIEIDNSFCEIVKKQNEAYKSEWDDGVHDSYQRYLSQIENLQMQFGEIRTAVEIIDAGVTDLCIDKKIEQAEKLCEEAANV